MLKFIGLITGKKELRRVASLFRYFEKVHVDADTDETYAMLGQPEMDFQQWLKKRKDGIKHQDA